jgi:dihydrofolate reductase
MRTGLAGGAELYGQTMPLARQLDITYLHIFAPRGGGDAYFPAIDRSIWHEPRARNIRPRRRR